MSNEPEVRWPTPNEWIAKFMALDQSARETYVARVIRNLQTAEACFTMNHRGRVAELEREKYELMEQVAFFRKDLGIESELERLNRRVKFLENLLDPGTAQPASGSEDTDER